eukprot:GHRR01016800.1.p1 GENE.GHRR01016800.1~~GHRR01016800.1.p1  ORF type:complete len:260 (+),score=69.17 GHRR01016800.1:63-782(+)
MTTVKQWAWQCQDCQRECVPVRAESRCMCGHRLKEHAEGHKCMNRSCNCPRFSFIVAEGSWVLRCRCKHKHTDHDPITHECKKSGCLCIGFCSPWVCNCDHAWCRHEQVMVERQVLRLSDMIAQQEQQVTSRPTAKPLVPDAASSMQRVGVQTAVAATAAVTFTQSMSRISTLQQLAARGVQQQQMGSRQQHVAAVTPFEAAAVFAARSTSGRRQMLLANADCSCEVNRFDLLQRGKQD